MKEITLLDIKQYAERESIGFFLSSYPENMIYPELLTEIENGSTDITCWEPFEYSDPSYMADIIDTHKDSIIISLCALLDISRTVD